MTDMWGGGGGGTMRATPGAPGVARCVHRLSPNCRAPPSQPSQPPNHPTTTNQTLNRHPGPWTWSRARTPTRRAPSASACCSACSSAAANRSLRCAGGAGRQAASACCGPLDLPPPPPPLGTLLSLAMHPPTHPPTHPPNRPVIHPPTRTQALLSLAMRLQQGGQQTPDGVLMREACYRCIGEVRPKHTQHIPNLTPPNSGSQ